MTPAQLRRRAAARRHEAKGLLALAELDEAKADELERAGLARVLPDRRAQRKVFNEHMTPEALAKKNVAISEGHGGDALTRACRAHGLTLRGLARELGMVAGSLIGYRKGQRPIASAVAKRVEELTGFEATKKNWPGGID